MNLSFYIARRYLISKKTHNAINVISMISVCGIAVATLAMVCALSIFNGFSKLAADSFSLIDPDLRITVAKGKVFDSSAKLFDEIKALPEIEIVSECIEENALVSYGERQEPVLVKGVGANFKEMVDAKKILVGGEFILRDGDVDFCVAGVGIAANMGLKLDNITPMKLIAPKRDVKVQMANPSTAFSDAYVFPAGVFALNQVKYDEQVVFISLPLARQLFRYDKEVSSLDIKLKEGVSLNKVQSQIQKILGSDYLVKNQFEQQADSYRMVNIEKWVTFLILAFILIIAAFNVVGSLSMLILDKSNDINILRNMGADNKLIARIFLIEGWLIAFTGALAGIILGLILCLAQQYFGILKLGQDPGAFIVDAYPVEVLASDIFFVFMTVLLIGGLIVLYPVKNLKRRLDADR